MTFEAIESYMTKTRAERRAHLQLEEPCIEIGGSSGGFRGLLAHFLKTTIPSGKQGLLCHACNNGKCSNVLHLYWGIEADNYRDRMDVPGFMPMHEHYRKMVGDEAYKEHFKKIGSLGGKKSTKLHLTEEQLLRYKIAFNTVDTTKRGWKTKLAKELGISHTHISRIHKKLLHP